MILYRKILFACFLFARLSVGAFDLGCENDPLFEDLMAEKSAAKWETDYRIPSDTRAEHYDLYLHPNLDGDDFKGRVEIEIVAEKDRDFFIVHTKYLTVTKTELKNVDGSLVEILDAFEYAPNEFWVVRLKQKAPAGNYTLILEYKGSLVNGIVGFYKSVYVNENGVKRSMATSKFQPTYARRAFPCFDEPSFKSTFKISIVKPTDGYIALSNMPIEEVFPDRPDVGLTEVRFQVSVPMVTYLAVFIVSDFVYIEKLTDTKKIPFRVYGTSRQRHLLNYALDVGAAVADFYVDYFNVDYPLPKLDMAAIPDYSSGATEHWGLITYRETNLIYSPSESSTLNKERVAEVIAHELAHQWFGNLMTLEWWNDLWLNEGFATYISYKGVKSAEPDWDMDAAFLTGDLHDVLDLDATLSSHPVVVRVDTPDQITSVFDIISYSKGSSVIRMMEGFMGSEEFRLGIHNFLVKFAFKNAVTQDLFDELAAVSSDMLDITKIMGTWTKQKGYPVLTLTKAKGGSVYKVVQERFLSDATAYSKPDEPSEFGYKWEVPVTYISSVNRGVSQVWLHTDQPFVEIPIPEGARWMKFNSDQFGYYRVNYPKEDWETLSQLLLEDHEALTVSDRANLINDAFNLAKGGRLPFSQALQLIRYLGNERSRIPWEAAVKQLKQLLDVFYYTDVYPSLISYLDQLVKPVYESVGGWNDTGDDSTRMLRSFIMELACLTGNPDCLDKAGAKFLRWRENGEPIEPNYRQLVYSFGMARSGNFDVWNWMLDKYRDETNAQEKTKLMKGLASVREPWILYRFLQLAKDPNVVREQDFFTLLTFVSANRIGEQIVWDFFRTEWDYLVDRFTLNDRLFGKSIATLTARFTTKLRLEEMKDFFAAKPEAGAGEMSRRIALEAVENNINFIQINTDAIQDWLNAHVHP